MTKDIAITQTRLQLRLYRRKIMTITRTKAITICLSADDKIVRYPYVHTVDGFWLDWII